MSSIANIPNTRAQFQAALAEIRTGSRDGIKQGLKRLDGTLRMVCPEIYRLGEEIGSLEALRIQKKACHILATLVKEPQTDLSDERLQNRLWNIDFLAQMSLEQGQTLTREVYQRMQESVREEFESGERAFDSEQKGEFQQRLKKAAHKLRAQEIAFALPEAPEHYSLPSKEQRRGYWKGVTETLRSKEGHIGVFYTHALASREDLVVKAPLRSAQECFASRIFQSLGFHTPDTAVVARSSSEGQAIEDKLALDPDFLQHRKDVSFGKFFVMNRVYGRTIEEIDHAAAAFYFKNDSSCLESILVQIGAVAAVDTLLHYQDRLTHIGPDNWGNLMCVEHKGRLFTTVAIDQSVDLSKTSPYLPAGAKISRIKEIVKESLVGGISTTARDLWEGIPTPLKDHIEQESALVCLQEGLEKGFEAIATHLTPTLLREIDASLSKFYSKEQNRDFVVVDDLIAAQKIIADQWAAFLIQSL